MYATDYLVMTFRDLGHIRHISQHDIFLTMFLEILLDNKLTSLQRTNNEKQ